VHVNPMFRVPHYEYHVEEWKDLKDDFLSSLHVKSPENIPSGSDYSVTTSYWDEFDYRDWLPFLEMVKPYISRIPSTETVTRVWYQTAQQYDYHTAHTHGSVGWSAVFYAHFNPEVHEATKFYCPFTNIMGDVELYCPDVREGDLIVFPAFLLHEAPLNKSTEERTIISFNLV